MFSFFREAPPGSGCSCDDGRFPGLRHAISGACAPEALALALPSQTRAGFSGPPHPECRGWAEASGLPLTVAGTAADLPRTFVALGAHGVPFFTRSRGTVDTADFAESARVGKGGFRICAASKSETA